MKIKQKITDSIYQEEALKKIHNDSLSIIKQRIDDSILNNNIKKEDSLRRNLKLFDVYKEGIVIKMNEDGHGLIMSFLKQISINDIKGISNPTDKILNDLSMEGWVLPKEDSEEIKIFKKAYNNEDFRMKFMGSKEKKFLRLFVLTDANKVWPFFIGVSVLDSFRHPTDLYFWGIKKY